MSRDGYLPPGVRQSDIDAHHDGSAYGYEPDESPQVVVTCPDCDGSGEYAVGTLTCYAPGCGFPYYEPDIRTCPTCAGFGELIEDARPDPSGDCCPYRHFTAEEEEAWARVFEGLP